MLLGVIDYYKDNMEQNVYIDYSGEKLAISLFF